MNNISDSSQVIDVSHSQVDRLQSEIDFPREEMKVKKKKNNLKLLMKSVLSNKHKSGSDNSSAHRNYRNLQNFSNNLEQQVAMVLHSHVSTETSKTVYTEISDLSSNNCD